jgi:transcriptional regulator with XRE-family HTH domain
LPQNQSDKLEDAERMRTAVRKFMAERKLSAYGWTKRAGVSKNSLLNFLHGRSDGLHHRTLDALARAAGTDVTVLNGRKEVSDRRYLLEGLGADVTALQKIEALLLKLIEAQEEQKALLQRLINRLPSNESTALTVVGDRSSSAESEPEDE